MTRTRNLLIAVALLFLVAAWLSSRAASATASPPERLGDVCTADLAACDYFALNARLLPLSQCKAEYCTHFGIVERPREARASGRRALLRVGFEFEFFFEQDAYPRFTYPDKRTLRVYLDGKLVKVVRSPKYAIASSQGPIGPLASPEPTRPMIEARSGHTLLSLALPKPSDRWHSIVVEVPGDRGTIGRTSALWFR